MAEYIYFAASLPSVWMDKPSPMKYEEFLEKAKEQLSEKDFAELEKASFAHREGKVTNKIVKDWDNFNFTFSEMLVSQRAIKNGKGEDPEYKPRVPRDENLEKKANEILSISNPLEAEKAILGEYFDFLSSHPVSSPFSLDALIIYGLKLQIKERVAAFSEEKGREEFDRLYRDIQSVITSRSDYGL